MIDATTYYVDEKVFSQEISDIAKVICLRRGQGMAGKLATAGNLEILMVVEAISGECIVQPPLVYIHRNRRLHELISIFENSES